MEPWDVCRAYRFVPVCRMFGYLSVSVAAASFLHVLGKWLGVLLQQPAHPTHLTSATVSSALSG